MNLQSQRSVISAVALLCALLAFGAQAQESTTTSTTDHSAHHAPATATAGDTDTQVMTHGEVLRVNLATGKVSIRHDAITNLNMPAMSMVFSLKDPSRLTGLKEGDKVRFHVERDKGALQITQIEVVTP